MNKLLFLAAMALGPWCAAQTTFTTIGNITFGSDGSTAVNIAGTTFVSGTSSTTAQILGSTLPAQSSTGSSTVQKIGDITFITDSNGAMQTVQTIGDTTFGSSGLMVHKIGNNIYFFNGGSNGN